MSSFSSSGSLEPSRKTTITKSDLCCPGCNVSILQSLLPSKLHSPIPGSILRSNSPFPEEYASSVGKVIERAKADLSYLEEKISALYRVLGSLKDAKYHRKKLITDHNRLFTPARRIPQDVWSYIFQLATEDSLDNPSSNSFDKRIAPLLLTRVCGFWRTIAIRNCPDIWSSLQIHINYRTPSQGQMLLLQTFLARSGTVPLSVNIATSDTPRSRDANNDLKSSGAAATMYSAIWMHSDRLEDVSFDVPVEHTRFLNAGGSNFKALQKLKLFLRGGYPFEEHAIPTLFLSSPALKNLSVSTSPSVVLDEACLPWSQLEQIELHFKYTYSIIHVLHWASALRDLSIFLILLNSDLDDIVEPQPVKHDKLEILRLYGFQGLSALEMLEAPSLATLELSDVPSVQDGANKLTAFINRSKAIQNVKLSCTENLDFLISPSQVQNITSLQVSTNRSDESEALVCFLEYLSKGSSGFDVPLPSLRKLSIIFHNQTWLSSLLLKLKTILLDICRQISPHTRLDKAPELELISLEASLVEDSSDLHLIQQLTEHGLARLHLTLNIVERPKKDIWSAAGNCDDSAGWGASTAWGTGSGTNW